MVVLVEKVPSEFQIPMRAAVPAGGVDKVRSKPAGDTVTSAASAPSFGEVLRREIEGQSVRFSGHAQMRMRARNISLSEVDMARLAQAVDRASAKGARESLILMDNLALVVSIRNRTVITAVDGEHIKENVFTNIDSAVIV
ncbi:MAG: flagellar protein [Firmicutes bacterium]|nr:flagellar protein [Bacillota bacterium]MDH7495394.1 TIGR02530 family flagellar biosynthesis protein [Bacillota bacterium]